MPAGAAAKIISNTEPKIVDRKDNITAYITFATNMTIIGYVHCDT